MNSLSIDEQNLMREADWTSLVYAVERGMCTLMLGPDAMIGTLEDGSRLPVHVALASFVKAKLGPGFSHLDPQKPSSVAQAAAAHEDPFTLQGWVEEFYGQFDGDFEMLQNLASLPFDLIVNSSPGLSAHRIWTDLKPNTYSDFYDRTARARPVLPDPSIDAPVVYHLYGSLAQPSSLILSDSDRLDFIVSVASDEPPLPPKLKSAFCDPDRSFLFLGFDLGQWQFRVLLHVIARDTQRRYKSFAFEPDHAPDIETREFYRSDHKVHFVNDELPAFARELRARVRVPDESDAERNTELDDDSMLPPDAPKVYLCYASEDRRSVQGLADGLRANGINAWFDRDELRGGDRWDSKMRQTIAEDVDYVVVIQSANLLAKDVGYVNREIHMALDRQEEYRAPRRFLLPAVIDDLDNILDDLRDLQSIDLTDAAGIDHLVKAIRRDQSYKVRQGA